MHRLLSTGKRGLCLAIVATASLAAAQEPATLPGAPTLPPGSPTSFSEPAVVAPERTDVYSVYSDAFYNPQSVAQCDPHEEMGRYQSSSFMSKLFAPGRHIRFYAGADAVWYNRSKPTNIVLTTTTPDIFPLLNTAQTDPGTTLPQRLNPMFLSAINDPLTFYPITSSRDPNDPNLNRVFVEDPSVPLGYRSIGNVPEFLISGENRMGTQDFNFGTQPGVRSRIGMILPDGSSIEFNYLWVNKFTAPNLIDDVSGSSFFTHIIGTEPPVYAFQRFGYLNSPFYTTDPRFQGEQVRVISVFAPNNPANEIPAVPAPPATTISVPREPTNQDAPPPTGTGPIRAPSDAGHNVPNVTPGLLFRDGELAIAKYNYSFNGADFFYKRELSYFSRRNWMINLIAGGRYIYTNENFTFFFADTTLDRAARNPDFAPNSPTDPRGPGFYPKSQPVSEVVATYGNAMQNRMFGPELGINTRVPVLWYFDFEMTGKGSFLGNFMERTTSLIRGDGATLFNYSKERFATSGALEGQFGLNFHPFNNVIIRGGWECIWLLNVGTAVGTIDFNLANERRPVGRESLLWHGWFAGAEISF